ncbi:MAG: phosphomethylpyrimidine kinase [Methanoregula sp.]|jgi:hydroxymethylpyrimidine/phosphomethylpyrimidine kinase|uniref:thiamine-phosphate synthase family protein n=1 Tax=Methanoregula sp. TaxID=2052170 RepID=UPI0025F61E05|nr:thiamine-phosphate synthase family protein [Methanoregula sp.]MCK9631916.1 phosphomethylpyrimidine kinase [Methanoregula sp.]
MDPVSERNAVLARLEHAVALLTQSMSPELVPPAGAQVGYAIRGARDKNGIAAVEDRISGPAGAMKTGGPCLFGTDEEIARVILTVMRFDPRRRCAALLRYSDRALKVLDESLFLEAVSFDATKAPPGISTMDWGVASCCKEEVPDVIYSRGSRDTGAVLILLGEDPAGVANNIIICSNRI